MSHPDTDPDLTRSPAGPGPPAPPSRWLLVTGAVLTVIVVLAAWAVVDRITGLQQGLDALESELAEARTTATEAEGRAEAAETRAIEAERAADRAAIRAETSEGLAREAAQGRDEAERQRDTAEAASSRFRTQAQQSEQRATTAEQAADDAARRTAEAEQEANSAWEEAQRIRRARELELERLHEALGQIADTRRSAMGLVMNLGEDAILFDFDRAELRQENREVLARIAGILSATEGYRIQVFGHTDDVGTEEYNRDLSARRAHAVLDYLVEAGIDPAIIASDGLGESRPMVPGTDPAARARNRRVEIGIVDTVVDFREAAPELQ